jgi:steroid 5-alpha reductase family enzyme
MTVVVAAGVGLLTVLAAMTIAWVLSVRLRDASIADICWGPAFVLLAWLYCLLFDPPGPRPILIASLVTVWGTRLAVHIGRRHSGEDPRYASMRAGHGPAFWWRSLFVVFWLQAGIIWFVSLPLLAAARPAGPSDVTPADAAGLLLYAVGLAFEVVGDYQLGRFRSDAGNRGRVLDTGLWRFSRHPNYFGDALLWWGIFVLATSVPGGWLTAAGPAVMTFLLLRVSGVVLLERNLKASKPGYDSYVRRTSAFVPWFPRSEG